MSFDIGFGVLMKDAAIAEPIPEGYGSIRAYQLTWENFVPQPETLDMIDC